LHLRIALLLVVLALVYPLLRIADIFPTGVLVEAARTISDQRAGSLQYRFDQEAQLLDRASQRIIFGWGRYGRNRVYVQDYSGTGSDASVTDGRWIITLGQFGLFGFLAEFGLLALPVFRAAAALKVVKSFNDGIFLGALALILATNLVDLLPNSVLSSWTWLVAGSLMGCSEAILAGQRKPERQRAAFRFSEAKIQPGDRAESAKWL
jgi:hypothetical protein